VVSINKLRQSRAINSRLGAKQYGISEILRPEARQSWWSRQMGIYVAPSTLIIFEVLMDVAIKCRALRPDCGIY